MALLAFAETVQLLPDLSMFVHVAMILVMIWILNRTFFKPINRILEAREKNKGGRSSEAGEILKQVAEKESEYTAELLEARNEGYDLVEHERNEALGEKSSGLANAKQEISEYLESEMTELQNETEAAESELRSEAEKMADKISANILKAA